MTRIAVTVLALVSVAMLAAAPAARAEPATFGQFYHLSDLHLDPLYDTRFNGVECCRPPNGGFCYTNPNPLPTTPVPESGRAIPALSSIEARRQRAVARTAGLPNSGTYGTFGCDSPYDLFDSALSAMQELESDPKFIVVTGDFVAHHLPTKGNVLNTLIEASQMVRDAFPETPIFPSVGNNDFFPDYNSPDNATTFEWLGNVSAAWVGMGLLSPDTQTSFNAGGYYVASAATNLDIIALNTVVYAFNRTTYPLPADPFGQFAWLNETLADRAKSGTRVYITGHIPPSVNGYNSQPLWNETFVAPYYAIIDQYSDIIAGELFGHLHRDDFRVIGDPTNPLGSIMLAGSISPITGNNPSFRHVFFDASGVQPSNDVVDYTEYYLDVWSSNANEEPTWMIEYDFDSAYNLTAADTGAFTRLYHKLLENAAIRQAYITRRTAQYSTNNEDYLCALATETLAEYNACLATYVRAPGDPNL